MFETTVAGSLPKPAWLAEPETLWAPWRLAGADLERGKRDAALVWLKRIERNWQKFCRVQVTVSPLQSLTMASCTRAARAERNLS